MHYRSVIAALAGISCVAAVLISSSPKTTQVKDLREDSKINELFTAEQIQTLIENADRLEVASDVDGTLTKASAHISNETLDAMLALNVVIVTANSEEKVKEASNNYPFMFWEKNAGSEYNGTRRILLKDEENAAVIPLTDEAEMHFNTNKPFAKDGNDFLRKAAGYAISFDPDNRTDPYNWVLHYQWMVDQIANDTLGFEIEPSTNAIDLTLKRLNKGGAFNQAKEWQGPNSFWIALGDTEKTDGPMLAVADMGITVAHKFGDYIHFPEIMDTMYLLQWIYKLKNAEDLVCEEGKCRGGDEVSRW